jgi:predicted HD superfamily hydrolase involved in NAD metabolism
VNRFFSHSTVKDLRTSLSKKRFQHCRQVFETALKIRDAWKEYPVDANALAWAALFHDCGKELKKEERAQLMGDGPFLYGQELLANAKLSHAPLGAKIVAARYGIANPDVLQAIAYHPTGHPDLNPIGWIVYAADYLEPGRVFFAERKHVLDILCVSPLQGLRMVARLRIDSVEKKGKEVHPLAKIVEESLLNRDEL